MSIRQLQVSRDTIEDRLMLRIGTHANEEIRVWFTRRFLRELWPHMTAMLAGHLAARPQSEADTDVISEASFDQPFRDDDPCYPLGFSPLLPSEATLKAAGDDCAHLIIREGRERTYSFNLNGELLQAFCAMLRSSAEGAGWDLALDYTSGPSSHEHPTTLSGKPILLH